MEKSHEHHTRFTNHLRIDHWERSDARAVSELAEQKSIYLLKRFSLIKHGWIDPCIQDSGRWQPLTNDEGWFFVRVVWLDVLRATTRRSHAVITSASSSLLINTTNTTKRTTKDNLLRSFFRCLSHFFDTAHAVVSPYSKQKSPPHPMRMQTPLLQPPDHPMKSLWKSIRRPRMSIRNGSPFPSTEIYSPRTHRHTPDKSMIAMIIGIFDSWTRANWCVFIFFTACFTFSETNLSFQVNPRFAIDYVRDDPVVVCRSRGVWSDSGGPLGHPKVYINLVSKRQREIFLFDPPYDLGINPLYTAVVTVDENSSRRSTTMQVNTARRLPTKTT